MYIGGVLGGLTHASPGLGVLCGRRERGHGPTRTLRRSLPAPALTALKTQAWMAGCWDTISACRITDIVLPGRCATDVCRWTSPPPAMPVRYTRLVCVCVMTEACACMHAARAATTRRQRTSRARLPMIAGARKSGSSAGMCAGIVVVCAASLPCSACDDAGVPWLCLTQRSVLRAPLLPVAHRPCSTCCALSSVLAGFSARPSQIPWQVLLALRAFVSACTHTHTHNTHTRTHTHTHTTHARTHSTQQTLTHTHTHTHTLTHTYTHTHT